MCLRRVDDNSYTRMQSLRAVSHSVGACAAGVEEKERLQRTEMRMLRWILGLTLRDKKRNDDIRCILGVACITDKVREARLRWFGHVQRREEEDCVRRILEADVHGQRSRGRQRKRWIDVVKYNMEDLRLDLMDVGNS